MGFLLGKKEPTRLLTTGIPSIDAIFGGGLRPGLVEVSGPAGAGKSILVAKMAGGIQAGGGAVGWIDIDNSLDPDLFSKNLDQSKLLYIRDSKAERVLGMAKYLPMYLDLLVLDNINSLDFGSIWEDGTPLADKMSLHSGALAHEARFCSCTTVLINQEYTLPGGKRIPGGRDLKHSYSVRLYIDKTGRTHSKDGAVSGITSQVTTIKNSYQLPYMEAHFAIEHGSIKDLGYSGGEEDSLPNPR
jgi:RecA/RadA recombinase